MAESERDKERRVREIAARITKEFADQGLIIQAGWAAFCIIEDIEDEADLNPKLKEAYFAGAQHLWSSVLSFLDEGSEPTITDLRRMDLIQQELDVWVERKKKELKNAKNK